MKVVNAGTASAGKIAATSDPTKRAALSAGSTNSGAIYAMALTELVAANFHQGTLVDVGCGSGRLFPMVRSMCSRYIGIDAVRYDGFPAEAEFHAADLDTLHPVDLPDEIAEAVVCIEAIEHLENPRGLMRELTRLAKSGAPVLVTTPNQLSWLSLLTLVARGQFNQFQEAPGLYPAHITHLLEADMIHIARECGLTGPRIVYSNEGRLPFTRFHWPRIFRGQRFSDNLMMVATKA